MKEEDYVSESIYRGYCKLEIGQELKSFIESQNVFTFNNGEKLYTIESVILQTTEGETILFNNKTEYILYLRNKNK